VSRVAREHRLDAVNLGYNGSARGEIVSAEHVAELDADVITICHGTNCWTRTPHSVGMVLEGTVAFLEVVRQGHPEVPILVVSPVVRPDAEETPNRLGATLQDLRAAIESVVRARIEAGDSHLEPLGGAELITEAQLHDGLHPDDDGHRALADAIGPRVAALAGVKAEA
jgi:lysophospholipase L1-like esterase